MSAKKISLEVTTEVLGTCACGQPATVEAYNLVPGPGARCVPANHRLLCDRCNQADREAIVARINAQQEGRV
jgi:hypothetical protein